MRFAICDDEPIVRNEIIRSLDEYARLRKVDILCDQYAKGQDFLKAKHQYSVVILDYQFGQDPNTNGLSIAKKLRKTNSDIAIIFLTNHPRVVFSSFEVDTFRFLVKPLDSKKLFSALDAYLQTMETDTSLLIRVDGATKVISTKQIQYLEGFGKYSKLYLAQRSEPVECHETLVSVEQRLPRHLFFRSHRSYIVNLKHVNSYSRREITLHNGTRILMSRNKYRLFEDAFIAYSKRYGY